MNHLQDIHNAGQSIWLDFITRQFMADGKLKKLINEDGLSGVTSNPTIFQKAFSGGKEYDDAISRLIREGKTSAEIFDALSIEDIQTACDQFRPVYDRTNGADGFVSLEVSPHFARDTKGTTDEARRLFRAVNRPNVMIKIPGTKEGLPAIEQSLGEGININITLIFSLQRYQEVMDAWLVGLERLAAKNEKQLCSVSSVASFFVSRVDSLVDGLLEKKNNSDLLGKAAIANARLAYGMFLKMKASRRYQALAAKGALIQRPLWASTSTKNPKYRDVIYVEELVGAETVNTLPLATIEAAKDHAQVRAALPADTAAADKVIADLAKAGISMDQVTDKLEVDGLKLFSDSYDELIKSLDQKKEALKAGALMQIGLVGLGRMGMNMGRRWLKGGHDVIAFNRTYAKTEEISKAGAKPAKTLQDLVGALKAPRVVWLMLPAGEATEEHLQELSSLLSPGDLVVDGGNNYYKEDIRHAEELKKKKVNFVDAGVSGGVWGLNIGYCTMVGGDKESVKRLTPLLDTLAPKDGWLHCGDVGGGHFVKMVHNGIEYGMMQAYAEGFEILQASPYKPDNQKVAHLWNQGSVVRSWLLELAEDSFSKDPNLDKVGGYVEDSGEGRWTAQQAIDTGVAAPVITLSLFQRFVSRQKDPFGFRLLAALRNEFGGHAIQAAGDAKRDGRVGAGSVQPAASAKNVKPRG